MHNNIDYKRKGSTIWLMRLPAEIRCEEVRLVWAGLGISAYREKAFRPKLKLENLTRKDFKAENPMERTEIDDV